MSEPHSVAAHLLVQILSLQSPEPGARLKQKLKQAFISSGAGEFNEKSFGFQKFTDYLMLQHGSILKIVRPEASGDVLVYLRNLPSDSIAGTATSVSPSIDTTSPGIRNDLWQAFVNPDPRRKRFFHKDNGQILHYLSDARAPQQAAVEASIASFIEIKPIPGELQLQWMRDFLKTQELLKEARANLEAIAATTSYTIATSSAFIKALGQHGTAWKLFRTARVQEEIEKWGRDTGVDTKKIHNRLGSAAPLFTASTTQSLPKQQVQKLLELLSDEDVSRYVLPLLLSTILVKSHS